MQGIYLWIMVSVGLGGLGFIIAFSEAMRERSRVLRSVPKETSESILEGEESPREELSGFTLVYAVVSAPAFTYTMLGAVLVLIFGINSDAQLTIASSGLVTLGLGSFFTNLGRSRIYGDIMQGINEWGEGSMNDFGRYMVLLVLFEPLAIYTLLIFELGLVFSGILGTNVSLSMGSANMYMYGALVLGLSCSTSLLMARAFHSVEEPLTEDVQPFTKKVTYMGITHIPAAIGLMVAVVLMVQSGLI